MSIKQRSCPSVAVLEKLFQCLYITSLQTEEREAITCAVVWLDPENPDPNPPISIRIHRWQYIPFATPLLLSPQTLTKLARSSDVRTSWLVMYVDEDNEIYAYGLIDQANQFYAYRTYAAEYGFEPPGLFQVQIAGVGHVIVSKGGQRVAELKLDRLIVRHYDVLRVGAVHNFLRKGLDKHVRAVGQSKGIHLDADVRDRAERIWIKALTRLLLAVQSHRHGGTILITSRLQKQRLKQKYEINFTRLREALIESSRLHIYLNRLRTSMHSLGTQTQVPIETATSFGSEIVSYQDALTALDGALWFVSLLSRVDGAVVLTPQLLVRAYGTEITIKRAPEEVYVAGDESGNQQSSQAMDYQHFGTRHRSVMRYCLAEPESVGFVISQEGDVRVIRNVDGRVVLWENIRLGMDEYFSP